MIGSTCHPLIMKKPEVFLVSEDYIILFPEFVFIFIFQRNIYFHCVRFPKHGGLFNSWYFVAHYRRQRARDPGVFKILVRKMHIRHHPVYPVIIFLKFLITEFILDEKIDHQDCTDANSKSGTVDDRKKFVSPKVS